ncbi:histone acetyltransferase type B catalytic subunit [Carica papaya]|uniref:histone acetyltransferase type B catalytic subunit n=1 Tax=Carica papaya TaxID=3649 RepID=UPI000B8CA338|nr:histone acetyltransferase type B catalytic subunit [Carica papaya]
MVQKNRSNGDPPTGPKKRRRVGFSAIDAGVDASECIKIYLVSSKEELGALDGCCINPVDLNSFFDKDGKIYGYKGLKINVWVSCISFHAYADIIYESSSDGGKGITDLKSALQRIFAETLVENKDDFLQTFSTQSDFVRNIVSNGEVLQPKAPNRLITKSNSDSEASTADVEVVRLGIGNSIAGHLYSRLVPLVLLLIDGSNPIDVTDPGWELYLLIQQGPPCRLLGFSAVYRFYRYPDSSRLRLSQILVLPPYQHMGYGSYLVEVLNNVAISENVYDLTVEEPLEYFQHIRTCVDIHRLLTFEPIQQAIISAVLSLKHGKLSKKSNTPRFMPPSNAVEDVRKILKINKKQFLKCWEVLIYLGLDPVDKYLEDYIIIISNHVKADILGKDSVAAGKRLVDIPSDHDPEMSFVMFNSHDGEASSIQMDENQANQREQLQQLVDERVREIKSVAQKADSNPK